MTIQNPFSALDDAPIWLNEEWSLSASSRSRSSTRARAYVFTFG